MIKDYLTSSELLNAIQELNEQDYLAENLKGTIQVLVRLKEGRWQYPLIGISLNQAIQQPINTNMEYRPETYAEWHTRRMNTPYGH